MYTEESKQIAGIYELGMRRVMLVVYRLPQLQHQFVSALLGTSNNRFFIRPIRSIDRLAIRRH